MKTSSSPRLFRLLLAVAVGAVLAVPAAALHADTIVTDRSGNRILLKSDGTYRALPRDATRAGSASAGSAPYGSAWHPNSGSSAGPAGSAPAARAPSWSAPSSSAREPNAAEYQRFTLDKVRAAAVGTLVSLDGWVGKYGAEGQILMFRDRTVAPPFVLIRLQDAGPGRAGRSLASLLARCQSACPVRVKGEVLPVTGEVPAIFAHAIDVIG